MQLHVSAYITLGFATINVWTEAEHDGALPTIIRSVYHNVHEVPDILRDADETTVLLSLVGGISTSLYRRRDGQGLQPGS